MADDFVDIANTTFRFEGGLNQNEIGQGGKSNYGITQDLYDSYNKEGSKDVSNISYGEAKRIMKEEFYDKPKISSLKDNDVRGIVYDFAVNSGSGTAIRSLQKVIGTKEDGIIGKNTKRQVDKYIKKNGQEALTKALIDDREAYLTGLYTQNPERYGRVVQGWMNRLQGLRNTYSPSE